MASFACTICGRPVPLEGGLPATYPFCSERCRLVDLGHWLRGDYAIERELSPEEIEQARSAARFRPDVARDGD